MLLIYAPDGMRGRLQGVFTVVVAGGPRLGDLRAGAMAAGFGGGVPGSAAGSPSAVLAVCSRRRFPALLRYRAATASSDDRP